MLLILVLLVGVGDVVRLLILNNSLYRLNLNASTPVSIMEAPRAGQKILIFAPHEDDETLGTAGFIQQAVAAKAQVRVVLMTNGEYPEISVVLFEERLPIRPQAFIDLGYLRQRETLAAMNYLGVPGQSVTFLGYPNEYLNQMWLPAHWLPAHPVRSIRTQTTYSPYNNSLTPHATYCGQSMLEDVETVLQREQPDIVITIQPNDVHVDHWPTYTVVRYALNELAARRQPFASTARVYTYLIHRDQWPAPRGYWPALNLEPPARLARLGVTEWQALPLTVAETIDKHKATTIYRSQGGRWDRLLLAFARANELYGIMPTYNWPAANTVPGIEVIKDPAADLTSSALDAHGDIIGVWLRRAGRRMTITVQTRGTALPRTGYHMSLHAGGATPADRLIAEYDWQGANASGLVLRNGVLRKVDGSVFTTVRQGNTVNLTAPWPLTDTTTTFFLARAWTTRGTATIDQTATSTYLMQPVFTNQAK